MLLVALRVAAFAVGSLAYYCALFLRQNREGKLQNRIEELWINIDEKAKQSGSKTAALFNAVAGIVTRGFDRILGRRLFSLQLLGVSTSYALAAMALNMGFVYWHAAVLARHVTTVSKEGRAGLLLFGLVFVLTGCGCLLVAALPSLFPGDWFVGLSLVPGLFITLWVIVLIRHHLMRPLNQVITAALVLSLLSDVLLLTLARFIIRRVLAEPSFSRIVIALLIQVGIVSLLVVGPWKASLIAGKHFLLTTLGAFLAIFNIFTGLASSAFILALLFLLLHKTFWPMLSEVALTIADRQVIRNHSFMGGIGTTCYAFAFSWLPGWLHRHLS